MKSIAETTISLKPPRTTEEISAAVGELITQRAKAEPYMQRRISLETGGTVRVRQFSIDPSDGFEVTPSDAPRFTPGATYSSLRVSHCESEGEVWASEENPVAAQANVDGVAASLNKRFNG